jgi:hypothetical protein
MTDKPKGQSAGTPWLDAGRAVLHLVLLIVSAGGIALILRWAAASTTMGFASVISLHAPAILGISIAGLASLCLVAFFRAADGPLQLDILGLKLAGGSASLVLWALGFLTLIGGWRLLS